MRATAWVIALGLVACSPARSPGQKVTSSTLTPDSECGELVEPEASGPASSLLGSCTDEKTCTEYRWDAETDPTAAFAARCESAHGSWSVGACQNEKAVGGCRTALFYERCRSTTTTWVLDPSALEPTEKRCAEIHGEVLARSGPAPFTPEPDPEPEQN